MKEILILLTGVLLGIFGVFYFYLHPYMLITKTRIVDVRSAPHWDLVKHAWTNDNDQLLLKNSGNRTRDLYYNWMDGKWEFYNE